MMTPVEEAIVNFCWNYHTIVEEKTDNTTKFIGKIILPTTGEFKAVYATESTFDKCQSLLRERLESWVIIQTENQSEFETFPDIKDVILQTGLSLEIPDGQIRQFLSDVPYPPPTTSNFKNFYIFSGVGHDSQSLLSFLSPIPEHPQETSWKETPNPN